LLVTAAVRQTSDRFRTSALQRDDVAGLQAFGAGLDSELDALALIQGAETVGLDSGKVDENIFAAIAGDEAIAFAGVEPFDGALYSFGHGGTFTPVKKKHERIVAVGEKSISDKKTATMTSGDCCDGTDSLFVLQATL
jgi:hypothetical protein